MSIRSVLWHSAPRSFFFFAIWLGVAWGLSSSFGALSLKELWPPLPDIMRGDFTGVARREFAFALAALLGVTGAGFLFAFLVMHVVVIRIALWRLRTAVVERAKDATQFAANYDAIDQRLSDSPLIGRAWGLFAGTLIRPGEGGVWSTFRASAFINFNAARETLPGLKLMGAIPGYYVGVGLLLTFIGLVLALNHAAEAVNSQSAEGMQTATRGLLSMATFKFATSIAGLGVSIVLSIFFRLYVIWIEGAFDRFNYEVERRLTYVAPQAIALESKELMQEQANELKAINSEQFFSRLGEQMSPHITSAFSAAVAPMNESIQTAVSRLSETSHTGVENLIEKFTASVQGGAGQELRALAVTLDELRRTLGDAQRGIHGSGEDFGRRMSEAASNLSRLVEQAAGRLDEGSEKSRAALDEIVAALRETFRETNAQVQQAMSQTTGVAAAQMQETMGALFRHVETQVSSFRSSVGDFEKGLGAQFEETRRGAAAAQAAAVEAVGAAGAEAAKALKQGLDAALERIHAEIGAFVGALSEAKGALAAQAASLHEAAGKSRSVADAFHETATDLRLAASPLIQSGERIAQSTERFDASVKTSVEALTTSHASSWQLVETLDAHHAKLTQSWEDYEERFAGLDRDLAAAFEKLREGSENLGQVLAKHVAAVDGGMAGAVDKLGPVVSGLNENVEGLTDAIERLAKTPCMRAAE